ncbi:MAG: GNAT family N-acetyltransferase [Patescibacteria group bacterium]
MSSVRKATEKNLPAVLALMETLVEEHCRLDPYYKPFSGYRGMKKYLSAVLKDSEKILLVAEKHEKVIGYFLGVIEEAPFYTDEKEIGVVSDTCVDPKERQQGILKEMFEKTNEWFAKKGVRYIELSVDARNSQAITAWRKLGFEDYKLRLRKKL